MGHILININNIICNSLNAYLKHNYITKNISSQFDSTRLHNKPSSTINNNNNTEKDCVCVCSARSQNFYFKNKN